MNIENIDNQEDKNELGLTDNQMIAIELDFIEIFKVKLDEIMKAKSSISQ